jgi:hypothetical protein
MMMMAAAHQHTGEPHTQIGSEMEISDKDKSSF